MYRELNVKKIVFKFEMQSICNAKFVSNLKYKVLEALYTTLIIWMYITTLWPFPATMFLIPLYTGTMRLRGQS